MEHRAPSGKGRSRGRGNERSNTRSARHTLGAGSRSSRHTTLVAEMLRGGGGERCPPNTETKLHSPRVDSRLQIRLPPSCQRHQNTEGGGGGGRTQPSLTRTNRPVPRVSSPWQIRAPPRCSHRRDHLAATAPHSSRPAAAFLGNPSGCASGQL
jgi:hypothetical protein